VQPLVGLRPSLKEISMSIWPQDELARLDRGMKVLRQEGVANITDKQEGN